MFGQKKTPSGFGSSFDTTARSRDPWGFDEAGLPYVPEPERQYIRVRVSGQYGPDPTRYSFVEQDDDGRGNLIDTPNGITDGGTFNLKEINGDTAVPAGPHGVGMYALAWETEGDVSGQGGGGSGWQFSAAGGSATGSAANRFPARLTAASSPSGPYYSWTEQVWSGGVSGGWANKTPLVQGVLNAREVNDHPSVHPVRLPDGAVVDLWQDPVQPLVYHFWWEDANPIYTSTQTVTYNNSFVVFIGVNLWTFQAGSTTTWNLQAGSQIIINGTGIWTYNVGVEFCNAVFWCENTEPTWAANQNDWVPANEKPVHRLSASSAISLSGMIPAALADASLGPEVRVLVNVGTGTFTVTDNDAGSAAAHQFILPDGYNLVLADGDALFTWYDRVTRAWRVFALTNIFGPISAPSTGLVPPPDHPHGANLATDFLSANANWLASYKVAYAAGDAAPDFLTAKLKGYPGYAAGAEQLLGHDASGNIMWFNVTTC